MSFITKGFKSFGSTIERTFVDPVMKPVNTIAGGVGSMFSGIGSGVGSIGSGLGSGLSSFGAGAGSGLNLLGSGVGSSINMLTSPIMLLVVGVGGIILISSLSRR